MGIWELIGMTASITGAVSLVPEVLSAFKTHELEDLAWGMLALYFVTSLSWEIYGILSGNNPLIFSAGINMVMEISLMGIKLKYGKSLKNSGKLVQELMIENSSIPLKNNTNA